jgi:hypothetical protein
LSHPVTLITATSTPRHTANGSVSSEPATRRARAKAYFTCGFMHRMDRVVTAGQCLEVGKPFTPWGEACSTPERRARANQSPETEWSEHGLRRRRGAFGVAVAVRHGGLAVAWLAELNRRAGSVRCGEGVGEPWSVERDELLAEHKE